MAPAQEETPLRWLPGDVGEDAGKGEDAFHFGFARDVTGFERLASSSVSLHSPVDRARDEIRLSGPHLYLCALG